VRFVFHRLFVGGDITLVVAQDDFVVRHTHQVIGHHRDFSAAAGGIDHIGRHCIARGVPAQPFNDLHAFGHRRAEVPGAFHQVALVDVVGPHADAYQVLHQLALDVHAVVDPRQQHALVAQRHTGTGQAVAGVRQFLGDFIGMVDVNIHPQRVVFCERVAEFAGDALGQKDRHAAADADDLDVLDFAQAAQQFIQ
jgi:hypothetical protein